ncbi:MAG: hypothetical protein WBF71_01425 [Microthrixaceae bacterium]
MSDSDHKRLKEYVGYIWIGNEPGQRINVWAESADEAARKVEAEYGEGHPFSIRNPDDAERKR